MAAQTTRVDFLSPVGRLVMGSLYEAQTTDAEGKPLVIKTGQNAGQPTQRYFFALAIAKQPEHSHWGYTEWGAKILQTGRQCFPQGQAEADTFAWKIVDGDSTKPNTQGRKPCDREGYPGHWVLSYSSSYAPKIVNRDGSAPIMEPNAVKLGYFVQVMGSVDGNGQQLKPGVYLNHSIVSLQGYGPEITVGPDPKTVGFGQQALPQGASATPLAGMPPAAGAGAPPPGGAPAGATPPPPGQQSAGLPPPGGVQVGAGALPAQVPVTPNTGFLNAAPPPGGAPAAGAGAPPPPGQQQVAPPPPAAPKNMLPAAGNVPYADYIAKGWTDAQLIQHGLMSA